MNCIVIHVFVGVSSLRLHAHIPARPPQESEFSTPPFFTVLDEATSALDVATEKAMYEMCQELDIAVVSVGHRQALAQVRAAGTKAKSLGTRMERRFSTGYPEFGFSDFTVRHEIRKRISTNGNPF